MTTIILDAQHVGKAVETTEKLTILQDISFQLNEGDSLAIIGSSGSGKSTLLGLLAGLDVPTDGEILFQGKNVANLSKKEFNRIRPKMQMIFQDPYSSLNGRMNVFQLIAEPLIVNKICRDKKEIETT